MITDNYGRYSSTDTRKTEELFAIFFNKSGTLRFRMETNYRSSMLAVSKPSPSTSSDDLGISVVSEVAPYRGVGIECWLAVTAGGFPVLSK